MKCHWKCLSLWELISKGNICSKWDNIFSKLLLWLPVSSPFSIAAPALVCGGASPGGGRLSRVIFSYSLHEVTSVTSKQPSFHRIKPLCCPQKWPKICQTGQFCLNYGNSNFLVLKKMAIFFSPRKISFLHLSHRSFIPNFRKIERAVPENNNGNPRNNSAKTSVSSVSQKQKKSHTSYSYFYTKLCRIFLHIFFASSALQARYGSFFDSRVIDYTKSQQLQHTYQNSTGSNCLF